MKADVNLEFFLDAGTHVLGKHIALLKAVKQTKSITKAADVVGISYKNAWDSLDIINNKSPKPLIVRAEGSKKNSGSQLSPYGERMIALYDALQEAQKEFLSRLCEKVDFNELDVINLNRMSLNLSARNQLACEITQIKTGAVNTQILARLAGGEILAATITRESEKNLGLEIGKKVVFIFKAPSVTLAKSARPDSQNNLNGKVIEAKIGESSAEISLKISNEQTLTAIISKQEAMDLQIGAGDELTAHIDQSQIIIGV